MGLFLNRHPFSVYLDVLSGRKMQMPVVLVQVECEMFSLMESTGWLRRPGGEMAVHFIMYKCEERKVMCVP